MKKLYLDNGYFNIRAVMEYNQPFNFVLGGRGTGKTYGALSVCYEDKIKFLFMRRTKTALDDAISMNPMNAVAKDKDFLFTCHVLPGSKSIYGWYPGRISENGELVDADKEPMGIGGSLVKVGKTRGLDAREVRFIINDEFVKAPYEQSIKDEASAFFNAYETINRNRELNGEPPVQAFLLSNSDDMVNDYFIELGLVDVVDKMQQHGENFYIDRDRGLTISLLSDSPISKAKGETALYRFTKGTKYERMAVGNEFVNNTHKPTKSMPLIEFVPVVKVGELVIYKHKSKDLYYGCLHLSGSCKEYGTDETEVARFTRNYFYLWDAYMLDELKFETYTSEALFNKYFE